MADLETYQTVGVDGFLDPVGNARIGTKLMLLVIQVWGFLYKRSISVVSVNKIVLM